MIMTDEMRAKAAETRANNLPQVALPEETETYINIDYFTKMISIDTCKATVMNRMARKGFVHTNQETMGGQVFNRRYEIPFSEMSKVVNAGLFK